MSKAKVKDSASKAKAIKNFPRPRLFFKAQAKDT